MSILFYFIFFLVLFDLGVYDKWPRCRLFSYNIVGGRRNRGLEIKKKQKRIQNLLRDYCEKIKNHHNNHKLYTYYPIMLYNLLISSYFLCLMLYKTFDNSTLRCFKFLTSSLIYLLIPNRKNSVLNFKKLDISDAIIS